MSNFDSILDSIRDIQQARSDFQLQKFVVGQHLSPEMQFFQVCIELNSLMTNIRMSSIDLEKAKIILEQLLSTGDPIDALEAEKTRITIEQLELGLIGASRELDSLLSIYNSFDKKYSREEIEAAQPEYWKNRLLHQAKLQLLGQGYVDQGHMESLSQIGELETFVNINRELLLNSGIDKAELE